MDIHRFHKKCLNQILVFLFTVFFATTLLAAEEIYSFQTKEQQVTFERLTKKLRCVTCPNQSLADSYAPVAESMRAQIHEMIWLGKSEMDIEHYFLERYGDYVLYKPNLKHRTIFLWFGPLIFLMIGIIFLIRQIYQVRSRQLKA